MSRCFFVEIRIFQSGAFARPGGDWTTCFQSAPVEQLQNNYHNMFFYDRGDYYQLPFSHHRLKKWPICIYRKLISLYFTTLHFSLVSYETVEVSKSRTLGWDAKLPFKRDFLGVKVIRGNPPSLWVSSPVTILPRGKNFGDRLCADDEVLEMMEACMWDTEQPGAPVICWFILFYSNHWMKSLPRISWRFMMIRYGNLLPILWYGIDWYKETCLYSEIAPDGFPHMNQPVCCLGIFTLFSVAQVCSGFNIPIQEHNPRRFHSRLVKDKHLSCGCWRMVLGTDGFLFFLWEVGSRPRLLICFQGCVEETAYNNHRSW